MGMAEATARAQWGKSLKNQPVSQSVDLLRTGNAKGRMTLHISMYDDKLQAIVSQGHIHMMKTLKGYEHPSARGIRLGASPADVKKLYGFPTRIVEMVQGESWVYTDEVNIAFRFLDNRVTSWLVFE